MKCFRFSALQDIHTTLQNRSPYLNLNFGSARSVIAYMFYDRPLRSIFEMTAPIRQQIDNCPKKCLS
ncbi:protein of unknown function [Legionella micdadei]|uniref:Uncharacterized protein n=1 Tax=Legionella micdadei TaxID=451 RepID=A0A098GJG4_LEGMI|nr:protein of unknown function [Legionella micdadei]